MLPTPLAPTNPSEFGKGKRTCKGPSEHGLNMLKAWEAMKPALVEFAIADIRVKESTKIMMRAGAAKKAKA